MDHENVRPDMLLLGKALAGGLYPVGNDRVSGARSRDEGVGREV